MRDQRLVTFCYFDSSLIESFPTQGEVARKGIKKRGRSFSVCSPYLAGNIQLCSLYNLCPMIW